MSILVFLTISYRYTPGNADLVWVYRISFDVNTARLVIVLSGEAAVAD
jgi:hypothetical protein